MRNHLKTSLGICKWGNGHNWNWAKLPLVELSQVTAPGDHLQLIQTRLYLDEITLGRVVLGIDDKTLFR